MTQYFTCPICGADVPIKARACPECGSDKETGWSQEASYIHLLPDKGESETHSSTSKPWLKYLIAVIALLTICAYLAAQGLAWSLYLLPFVALIGGLVYYVTQVYPNTRLGQEKQLYQNLLQKTRGDKKLVERLIEYEKQRNPRSNRHQLLQDAIARWERDRKQRR